MKRFGVNWLGIFAANAVMCAAIFGGLIFLGYELSAAQMDYWGRPRLPLLPLLFLPFLQAVFLPLSLTRNDYGRYRNAVNGKMPVNMPGIASWKPDVSTVSPYELCLWWLKGTSLVGVPYALAHFFTGRPSVFFVILFTLLLPAIVVLANAAGRRIYRSGILNQETTFAPERTHGVSETASVAGFVTQPVAENAILSVGSDKKP